MNILTNTHLKQNYVLITPLKVNYKDTINATRLFVGSIHDNLQNECTFSYTLRGDRNQILFMGNVIMNGTDYANWTGDNTTPFTYVAGKIGVTIGTGSGTTGSAGSSGSSGSTGTSGTSGSH